MKKTIIFLLFAMVALRAQSFVKSLQVYPAGNQKGLPVVINSDDLKTRLTIEFDVKSKTIPNMKIIFRFCDRNWMPYEGGEFRNYVYTTDFSLNSKSVSAGVKGADYHFEGTYPSDEVKFPFAGKWIFDIVDAFDESIVYEYGSFYVVDKIIKDIDLSIENFRISNPNSNYPEMDRSFQLNVDFKLPEGIEHQRLVQLEVIENRKIESPIVLNRDNTNQYRYYEWNGFDEFRFVVQDILPGNEYRRLDMSNRNKYQFPETKANFAGVDRSRLYLKGMQDNNGGYSLTSYQSDYSKYLKVDFEFKPTDEVYDNIYVTGSFNGWRLLPEYKLKKKDDIYSRKIELKRGSYEYQYVLVAEKNNEILKQDWHILEGNFWETKNEYFIFVVYNSPEKANYDKIIGFSKIMSNSDD